MIALARKYRPTRFAALVAQDHVAAGLAGAVAKGRVAHAYLLTGPRGVGKTTAARILAMALNCEQRGEGAGPAGEPCGQCDSCRRIWSGAANLDVVEIDAASNRGVDDARELRERAMYAASAPGRHKVYIVDEAHMLTREAWNALLKILEEPPSRVVFVFATTEPHKIANTAAPVLSRLQRFDFRRIGPQAIVERLREVAQREEIAVEDDALRLIARVANGALRDALSLLDQALAFGEGSVTATRVRDALGLIADELYAELLEIVAQRRPRDVFPYVARLVEAGADLVEFVNGLGEVLRALLLKILGGEPEGLTDALRVAVERYAPEYSEGDVLRMLRLLGDAEAAIRRSPNARLHVEAVLLQWTLLDRTVELAEVLEALRGSGGGLAEGRTPERVTGAGAVSGASGERRSSGPLTLERLAALWPDMVEAVGERRRFVREALGRTRPVALDGDRITVEVPAGDVHREALEQSRRLVAEAITQVCGTAVSVEYASAPPAGEGVTRRMNQETDRAERLRRYRDGDPALDAAAEALDLELLD